MNSERDADYAQAGFGQIVGFGKRPALVVVDMCRAYFEESSPLFANSPDVVESCKRLVAAARAAGIKVCWTRVEYEPGGANGGSWYRKIAALSCFDRGNPLAQWVDGLAPIGEEWIFTKQHASGFFGTRLGDYLKRIEADTVVVAGVSTSGCVRATATDASAHGFVAIVVRQAVGDRNPDVHEANLFDLNAKYADVVNEVTALTAFRSY